MLEHCFTVISTHQEMSGCDVWLYYALLSLMKEPAAFVPMSRRWRKVSSLTTSLLLLGWRFFLVLGNMGNLFSSPFWGITVCDLNIPPRFCQVIYYMINFPKILGLVGQHEYPVQQCAQGGLTGLFFYQAGTLHSLQWEVYFFYGSGDPDSALHISSDNKTLVFWGG